MESLSLVHEQRYAMGTMFDIIVYHASRGDASRAIEKAMHEIVRLDQVMSHYQPDSNLSTLNREAERGFVVVDPSLYDIIQKSIAFSRQSEGRFDVTIAPLLKKWKEADTAGRRPTASEIADARQCVGYEKIQLSVPNRVRFRSNCLELDLGGIGKGYAVERAIAILESEGIEHALVNAGGSSITSIGAPPGQNGWPVSVGANKMLLLRDSSTSTSQQNGEILDPRTGSPVEITMAVTVITQSATAADALSTSLLMYGVEESARLLDRFPGVSAIWVSPSGAVRAVYGESRLALVDSR